MSMTAKKEAKLLLYWGKYKADMETDMENGMKSRETRARFVINQTYMTKIRVNCEIKNFLQK